MVVSPETEGLDKVPEARQAICDQTVITGSCGQHTSLLLESHVHSEALRAIGITVYDLRESRHLLHQHFVFLEHRPARWGDMIKPCVKQWVHLQPIVGIKPQDHEVAPEERTFASLTRLSKPVQQVPVDPIAQYSS